ncbi:alpha/beta fold hydrolase [Nonomuraea sp. NPDC050790]|uniref:alpha/beta fold hydrolase n=1 Tax=Nonomuraea sp. NPDC050790 TaxID=3364371 RepID=UPI00379E758A
MTIWYGTAGSGDPLLLLHAGVADSRMWEPQLPALSERFQVIYPDFRGFGRTPYESAEPFSTCGDVAAVLEEAGHERAAIVASSYGCRIALQLAHQGRATRLVLLNPGSDLPKTDDVKAFGAEEDRLLERGDIQAAAELNARTWLGPEAGDEAHALVTRMQADAFSLQLGREVDEFEPDFTLAGIGVPALVVGGAHDLLHFRQSARHLAENLPDAGLVELGWAGHLPSLERPEEITALLLDYL